MCVSFIHHYECRLNIRHAQQTEIYGLGVVCGWLCIDYLSVSCRVRIISYSPLINDVCSLLVLRVVGVWILFKGRTLTHILSIPRIFRGLRLLINGQPFMTLNNYTWYLWYKWHWVVWFVWEIKSSKPNPSQNWTPPNLPCVTWNTQSDCKIFSACASIIARPLTSESQWHWGRSTDSLSSTSPPLTDVQFHTAC